MTDHVVRWGILGTGGIATTFVSDLPRVPGAQLAAVGSRSRDTAAAFAAKHAVKRAHGSWANLAADDEVDVIYVATPHHSHVDATLTCLEAGKGGALREAADVGPPVERPARVHGTNDGAARPHATRTTGPHPSIRTTGP